MRAMDSHAEAKIQTSFTVGLSSLNAELLFLQGWSILTNMKTLSLRRRFSDSQNCPACAGTFFRSESTAFRKRTADVVGVASP